MAFNFKQRSILPGFGLSLGFTVLYLSLIVLIPLSATFLKASSLTWPQFWHVVTSPRALASYRLSFGGEVTDRKSTRLNSSHLGISYAVFCLKKKTTISG